jgi:oligopeptide transport system ATP-binding protein
MTTSETILSVRDLTVSFRAYGGTVRALRGVSFDLQRGETLAVVGESGAGKSVCMKAIMGILPRNASIDGGSILYDGKDLAHLDEKSFCMLRGRRLGLIFQDPLSALNPIMKIGNQITEVFRKRDRLSRLAARKRALELMDAVGIPDCCRRFNAYPFQLSGGMRQRIVIAIALANNPEILICDEPTTALDVTIQARILDLIDSLKKKLGLSVIFITHDLSVVAKMADRVHVMYAGKIVESGLAEEVFFEPAHPYTWALMSAIPDLDSKGRLFAIPGTPPNMLVPIRGDAFAPRNPYAMKIDFEQEPPSFAISPTHSAATWLLHPCAPRTDMPEPLRLRIAAMKEEAMRSER